jgi:hypothetical protein
MNKQELINELSELADGGMDKEVDHIKADKLLLKYINDKDITKWFKKIQKRYA